MNGFIGFFRNTEPRVLALAGAETLVYASMYYIFPALLGRWEADFGWSKTSLTLALSGALVVAALCAPLAGHIIDRGHGRAMMTVSALAGGLLLGLLVFVETQWQFFALWAAMGMAFAGAFYEPCFAFVTHTRGLDARRIITAVTLIAGFASTVSYPLVTWLAEIVGWRASATGAAILLLAVGVPLMWFGTAHSPADRITVPRAPAGDPENAPAAGPVAAEPAAAGPAAANQATGDGAGLKVAMGRPVFWLLAFGFATIPLNHGVIITHLFPLLEDRHVPLEWAVIAAMGIGPMQVAGRIGMVMTEKRLSAAAVCALSYVALAIASGSLFAAAWLPLLIGLFVIGQGAGIGVTSITRPVVTADLLGRHQFGAISGALALPYTAAAAAAPILGSLIWEAGGYDAVLAGTAAMALAGLVAFLLALKLAKRG